MSDEVAIKVEHIGKTFHEQLGPRSFKQMFVGLGNGLMGKKEKAPKKGGFTALKDINFEVKKGEFFGIVGRNGSGKSTLLKIIAGVYAPTKGAVTINGKLTPFIELGVGFNPELCGRDNVFLNGALLGFTRDQMEAMYDDIVDFAELHDFMDVKLKNYSSGMQVRLAFSVAIRAESDILLIDEVLAVGDAAFQQKCFDYFVHLKNNKQTVVFISHDMESVRRFCDRVAYISRGKMKEIGKPVTITQTYTRENFGTYNKDPVDDETSKLPVGVKIKIIGSKSIGFGQPLKCEIGLNASEPRDIVLGVSILRNGVYVGGFNTKKYQNITRLKNGGNLFIADINTKSLSTGIYTVGCGVFEAESFRPVGLRLDGPSFNISESFDYKDGLANIDGEITNTGQTEKG